MKKLILILFLFSPVEAQIRFVPMEFDSPDTPHGDFFKYDKLDHFASHALLTMAIPTKKYNLDMWLSITVGLLWEIRDGFQSERTMGFSRTDFVFDIAGSIFGVWLKDLFHEFGVYVLINKNGISINF